MSAETAASGQLRAFVERAERLDEEIAALNADKRDLFAEAKGVGFDVKALKAVLGIRRKDPSERSEHNTLVALYLSTLGMADAADEVEQNDPHAHVQVQAHPRVREGDEIRVAQPAVPDADAVPAESFGKASATVETGHVDGGAGAHPHNSKRDEEGADLDLGAAEPLADDNSSAPLISRDSALELGHAASRSGPLAGGVGKDPSPGAGRESPGTLTPEREAAIAALMERQRNKPLDPRMPGFALAFRARHLRDPEGEEWATGLPADASQVAA